MTTEEKNAIVNDILASLATNSKTIEQLTPVTTLADDDVIEVGGGRYVTFAILKSLVSELSDDDLTSLQSQINNRDLMSVSVTSGSDSIKLSISSRNKTISCTILVATTSAAGLMSAADKVKVDASYNAVQSMPTLTTNVSTLQTGVSALTQQGSQLRDRATLRINGVLDAEPATVEESSSVMGAWEVYYCTSLGCFLGLLPTASASTYYRAWNAVVTDNTWYNDSEGNGRRDRLYLLGDDVYHLTAAGVLKALADGETLEGIAERMLVEFAGVVSNDITGSIYDSALSADGLKRVVLWRDAFYQQVMTTGTGGSTVTSYYRQWAESERYNDDAGKAREGVLYLNKADGSIWAWNGETVARLGLALGEGQTEAFAGERGVALEKAIANINQAIDNINEEVANFSPLGNDYNVTSERVQRGEMRELADGGTTPYDELATAIAYAVAKGVVQPGIHLTFAVAAGSWKSYIYVGTNTEAANIENEENWQDLAGMSAGSEPLININSTCPASSSLGGYYSLGSALVALRDYETAVGITYRKKNLVITYRTADGKSESKQYQGDSLEPTDFYNETAWEDYGKGSITDIKVNGQLVTPDRDGIVNIDIPAPEVDDTLDETSENAVKNAAIATELNERKRANITGIGIEGNADDGYQLKTYNAEGTEIDSVDLPSGGGGGSSEQTETAKIVLAVAITDGTEAVSTIREGSQTVLQYTYGHQYATGDNAGEDTGATGTLVVTIKNGLTKTFEATYPGVNAGPYELDITNYLRTGNNSVTIQATVLDPISGTEKRKEITKTVSVRRLTMSSTYDMQSSIRGGGYRPDDTAIIPFTCVASGKKDIHVLIDGTESTALSLTNYSGSSGEIRIPMTGLQMGRHNVQIYATQTVSELELQSETLFIDILKAPAIGDYDKPFIGVKMTLPSGTVFTGDSWISPTVSTAQYAQWGFDFAVLDPENIPATLAVSHNGLVTQTISANRTTQTYTNRFTTYGLDEMELTCGATNYLIHVYVEESRIDLSEVTDSVVLDLSAAGRSNSEQNPGQWSYGDIDSTFSGFDWLSDGSGWTGDSLKAMNGAGLKINTSLLAQNAANTGMTIEAELKCTNIVDREGSVIDCMDGNGVGFRVTSEAAIASMDGEGERVTTNFASGEWIRVGFVVSKATDERRLLSLYVNGVHDRTARFGATSAMLNALGGITISSDAADVEIRRIRAYNRALSEDEMLNNYIAGRLDTDEMIVIFDRNNVLDADKESIDIEQMRQNGKGVLRIIGSAVDKLSDLIYRNDKSFQMRVNLEYYSPYGREYDFRAENALIQIQGTSSVTYPRKNFDILFDALTKLWVNGVLSADNKYAFKPGARPVSIFCLKADFCDSSSTHNTGACKAINDLFRRCGWLTPAQAAYDGDYDVRVGIDSLPITLYNDNEGTGVSAFIGKYNFNNEKKGSGIVYGFEGIEGFNDEAALAGAENKCICLEFLENGHPIGLFQTDDLSNFDKALEFRFPTQADGSKRKWAQATDYQRTAIQRLWSWVRSTVGNPAKFEAEAGDYFLHDAPFVQYVLTDYFMAVDDRVKNMMLVTWDGLRWMFIPYDWDCLFGVDNTSHLRYRYDIDENTYDDNLNNYAFAGHDSALWTLVRSCPTKLNAVAATIRANMSVTAVKAAFSTEYEEAWSERVYNRDEAYKYIEPAFVDIEQQSGEVYGDYLFALQGMRKSHRDYMIENRFALLDSLYGIGDFRGNAQKVYLFGEFASDPRDIKITAFEKFGFGYGSNNADLSGKAVASAKGDVVTLTVDSNLSANDPQNIYGADRIEGLDLTDIADKIVSTLNLSACKRLRDLDLSNVGNDALEGLDVSGCRILRSLKMDGINGVKALDLSKNRKMETLEAASTKVRSVTFATGAITTRAALPATIQTLVLVSLPNLTYGADGLSAESWENMTMLRAEQLGAMNPVELLRAILASQDTPEKQRLSRVKIGGASTRGDGSELLALIDRGVVGVTNAEKPEVSGTYLLDRLIEQSDVERITEGIDGITVVLIIDAYISVVNEVNGEYYGGEEEVEAVTTDNISEHLLYYNGESYAEWLARYERDNMSIHDIIQL